MVFIERVGKAGCRGIRRHRPHDEFIHAINSGKKIVSVGRVKIRPKITVNFPVPNRRRAGSVEREKALFRNKENFAANCDNGTRDRRSTRAIDNLSMPRTPRAAGKIGRAHV